jgi:hypothetical protein
MEVVGTRIGHKLEARVRSSRNRTLQFGKSYDPVLSGSTTVRGTAELQRGAKQHLDGGEKEPRQLKKLKRWLIDLIDKK